MNEKTNFCPFCGTKIELDSHYCHICGANLIQDSINTSTRQSETLPKTEVKTVPAEEEHQFKKQDNGNGFVSILFAFLSIIGILPFLGAIVAIFTGGWKSGPLGIIGRSLGWFSFIFYTSFAFMVLV